MVMKKITVYLTLIVAIIIVIPTTSNKKNIKHLKNKKIIIKFTSGICSSWHNVLAHINFHNCKTKSMVSTKKHR